MPSPQPGALIVFDLDGTLVDTAPDLIGALNAVLAEEGVPPRPLDSARRLVGRGARFLIEHGFQEASVHLDEKRLARLTPRFLELYADRLARESRPFPNAAGMLDDLAASGVRAAVCTNKPGALARRLLDELGLGSSFICIVGADDTGFAKPDGRHLQHVLDRVGIIAASTCMVGDSEADVLAARAAETSVVVTSFGYTSKPAADLGADAVIDDLAHVPEVAGRLLLGLPTLERDVIALRPRRADA